MRLLLHRYVILTCWLLFGTLLAKGQQEEELYVDINRTAAKNFEMAQEAALNKDFARAIKLYQKALDDAPGLLVARRNMGKCFEQLNVFDKAAQSYETILKAEPYYSRVLYYDAAIAHYKSGNPGRALLLLNQYEVLQQQPLSRFKLAGKQEQALENDLLKELENYVQAVNIALDSVRFSQIKELVNVSDGINTKADEYFPFLSNNQQIMYYTRLRNGRADEDIFSSEFDIDSSGWGIGRPVAGSINTNSHEGMTTLVRDGRTLYFSSCGREGVLGPCDIWKGEIDGEKMGNASPLPGKANTEYWESQASISCDGSTLYFISNRPGGQGGTDIWYCNRLDGGEWSAPINMGKPINSSGDEESPFITNDGNTLYFSSLGHVGLGEEDLFISQRQPNGTWSKPLNLGAPVNSPFRELGFYLTADGKKGYLASNRSGGFGGLDIYRFDLPESLQSTPVSFVEGIVSDSILESRIPCQVQVKGKGLIPTDDQGRLFLCINANDTLNISIQKEGFQLYTNQFIIPAWDNKTPYTLEWRLKPMSYKKPEVTPDPTPTIINTVKTLYHHVVYFEFDKAELTPLEQKNLDQFLQRFPGQNIIKAEIIGFADDVGNDVYNLRLSEERAKKIGLEFVNHGILIDQISMEGRGEVQNGQPKSENRKVEIKIMVWESQ